MLPFTGTSAGGQTKDIAIGEDAIGTVIDVRGFSIHSDHVELLPYVHASNIAYQKSVTVRSLNSSPYVQIIHGSSAGSPNGGYVVIEYTLPT